MEDYMTSRNLKFVAAFGAAMLGSSFSAWCEDANQAALLKAMSGAKVSLVQGIAQVAKGTEVPTEAKYEMEDGKLMLSIYTSAKGFNTPAEDNSFVEYSGDATTASWGSEKGGVRGLQTHCPLGAVPFVAVDDQSDDPRDHSEGLGPGHGFFREGESPQRQARFRGHDCPGQYDQDHLL
jgi:hypothetical protein